MQMLMYSRGPDTVKEGAISCAGKQIARMIIISSSSSSSGIYVFIIIMNSEGTKGPFGKGPFGKGPETMWFKT